MLLLGISTTVDGAVDNSHFRRYFKVLRPSATPSLRATRTLQPQQAVDNGEPFPTEGVQV